MSEHLTSELLLRHLDGELGALEERRVEKHLRACWACQAELGRLKSQIAEIVEAEEKVFGPALPEAPGAWPRLEPRLEQVSAAQAKPGRPGWLAAVAVPRWAMGGVAAAVVVSMVAWLAAPKASAKELLLRATASLEERLLVSGKGVVRQRVRVKRAKRQGPVETAALSTYRWAEGSYWRLQEDAVSADLAARYAANGLKEALPLSGASLEGWTRLAGGEPRRSQPGGKTCVEVASDESARSHGLELVRVEMEGGESRVSALTLTFEDAEFRIQEEETVKVTRAELPEDVLSKLAGEAGALEAAAAPGPAANAPVQKMNVDELEMAVRYELHRLGADLGEGVEIRANEGEGVVVDAKSSSDEIKGRLKPLLAGREGVRLILQGEPEKTTSIAGVARVIPGRAAGGGEADRQLTAYFGSTAVRENFTKLALANSGRLLEHAYAWQELARRWPGQAENRLTAAAREQLQAMLRDHGREMSARVAELEDLLHPMVKAMGVQAGEGQQAGQEGWQASGERSVLLAQKADRLLRAMLTDSDQRVMAEVGLPQIVHSLEELEWRAQQLRRSKRQ